MSKASNAREPGRRILKSECLAWNGANSARKRICGVTWVFGWFKLVRTVDRNLAY